MNTFRALVVGTHDVPEKSRARAAVFTVLAARTLPVSDDVRARTQACTDLATLEAWLDRATVATTADELV